MGSFANIILKDFLTQPVILIGLLICIGYILSLIHIFLGHAV